MGYMKQLDIRIRNGGDDAVGAVNELMAELQRRLMELQESLPRWIPVEERLPEKGVPVIGWFPGAIQSFECALNEHDGVWCNSDTGIHMYDDERPTHWMPFPEGPTDAK